jgi:hypothetical protein
VPRRPCSGRGSLDRRGGSCSCHANTHAAARVAITMTRGKSGIRSLRSRQRPQRSNLTAAAAQFDRLPALSVASDRPAPCSGYHPTARHRAYCANARCRS